MLPCNPGFTDSVPPPSFSDFFPDCHIIQIIFWNSVSCIFLFVTLCGSFFVSALFSAWGWDGGRLDQRCHNYSFLHSQLCFLVPWFPFCSSISLKVCSIVGSIHPSIHSHTEAAGGGWSRHNYSKPFSYDWASSCCQAGTKRLSNFFQNHSWCLPILLLPCLLHFLFLQLTHSRYFGQYLTFIHLGFECDYLCRIFI